MILISALIEVPRSSRELVSARGRHYEQECRAEAGCVDYRLSWGVDDGALLGLLEIWEDADAYAAHGARPHVAAWGALMQKVGVDVHAVRRLEAHSL